LARKKSKKFKKIFTLRSVRTNSKNHMLDRLARSIFQAEKYGHCQKVGELRDEGSGSFIVAAIAFRADVANSRLVLNGVRALAVGLRRKNNGPCKRPVFSAFFATFPFGLSFCGRARGGESHRPDGRRGPAGKA
jgi:hypothetical protein